MKDAQAEPAADITADAVVTDPPATPPPVPPVPPVPPKATDPPPPSSTPPGPPEPPATPPAVVAPGAPGATPPDAAAIKATAEAEAAGALAAILKAQPGIVAELVTGGTVAEVQTSFAAAQKAYAEVKAAVLSDLGAAIPGGRASGGGGPVPSSPYDMILTGIAAAGNK